MARLTRTQKYAQLREQVANDRENATTTSQLEGYRNRLDNIQQTLAPKTEADKEPALADAFGAIEEVFNTPVEVTPAVETPVVDTPVVETPVVEVPVVETPVVTAPVETKPVEEAPKFDWESFSDDFSLDLDKIINDWKVDNIINDPFEDFKFDETPVVETPAETPVVETPVVETPVVEVPVVEEEVTVDAPAVEEVVVETPVEETETVEVTATEDDIPEMPVWTEPAAEENDIPEMPVWSETVETPVVEETEAKAETTVEETPWAPEKMETMEIEGPLTANEPLLFDDNTPVKEETPVEKTPAESGSYIDFFDVEFDDTTTSNDSYASYFEEKPVSIMEETKDEIETYLQNANERNEEVNTAEEAVLDADEETKPAKEDDEEFSNTVSMEISKIYDEVPAVEETIVNEHPVLAKQLEDEEEVVEIKNLKEIDIEPVKDATISSTIPFIVSNNDDDDEYEEDEEGSNTVLNIILVILIVILVAVLGLIVFYILKTKGII